MSAVVFTILGFLAGLLVNHLITRKEAVYSTPEGQGAVEVKNLVSKVEANTGEVSTRTSVVDKQYM